MIPTRSNLPERGCSPVSSNCVTWQGPCLTCIGVNTGDSVSDVVAALAQQVCELLDTLNITDLDFKCLVDSSLTTGAPSKNLSTAITLLINKVCSLEDAIGALGGSTATPAEVNVNIASCFQVTDTNGDTVTTLGISDYVKAIGNKVCSLASTVTAQGNTLTNHEGRLSTLENKESSTTLPTVAPGCLATSSTPIALDSAVEELITQFCALQTATGKGADLLGAVSKQCANINSDTQLSGSGNMSAISGWKSAPATVADSLNNMWLAICDIRGAVKSVMTCCKKTCADVIVSFVANITDNGATLKLFFSGYTFIPDGFSDCSVNGAKLTITDGLGGSYTTYIKLATAAASTDPISINVASTPLSPTGNYSLTLDSCLTDGTLTCNKSVVVSVTGTALSCNAPSNVTATLA